MHYLITTSNYDDFMAIKSTLDPVSDVDNISEICGQQKHPWYVWLTHKFANILLAEVLLIVFLLIITVTLTYLFEWALTLSIAFFIAVSFFSVWVSGLVGWHTLHLYMICQNLTEDEDHPLALLVDVEQDNELKQVVSGYSSSKLTLLVE